MATIFNLLYAVHPAAPLVFILVFANGLMAPALYHALARVPFDIGEIRRHATGGDLWAKYAYYSWLVLAAVVLGLVCVIVTVILLQP